MDILVSGFLLAGTYVLIAMGLNLQYGVARIMNLANGEVLIAGALAAFWLSTNAEISPLITIFLLAPTAFAVNWLIYKILLRPLVKRSKSRGQLEVDSILATFGLSFIMVGLMLVVHGEFYTYEFLSQPITILSSIVAMNRFIAFILAVLVAISLYFWLNHTRAGSALRAVAVSPQAAGLVGIDVPRVAAIAFALGGSVTAIGGALISTFITLDGSVGVVFTMKALIIVILGGVGDIRGAVFAALILGIVETSVATLIDPGLTLAAAYLIFVLILIFRPQGLFGRRPT
jgi:branched-chain amino acid transport system permease protein